MSHTVLGYQLMGLDLQFQFQQGFGFWATIFSFLVGVSLIFYIYLRFPQNTLVRLYLLLGLTGILWQLNDLLTHLSANVQTASFFDRLTSMGWNFIGPVCLHFVWYYTRFFIGIGRRMYCYCCICHHFSCSVCIRWIFIRMYLHTSLHGAG